MSTVLENVSGSEGSPFPPRRAAWTMVWILFALYVLSLLDRGVFALLIEPIRLELNLTDSQIALIKGFAFAVTYTVLALPFGYAADRWSRRKIVGGSALGWSIATAAFGLSQSFAGLFVARAALGTGEAALTPSAHSLIGDMFPRDKLTLPLSVFSSAAVVGAGISYFAGGLIYSSLHGPTHVPLLGTLTPWRLTFLICAIPGLLLALLPLTVREPARMTSGSKVKGSLRDTVALLRTRPAFFAFHFSAFSIVSIISNALNSWIPTYLIRHFGWGVGQVGIAQGLMLPIAGVLGYVFSVRLVSRMIAQGRGDAHFEYYVWATLGCAALGIAALLLPVGAWPFVLLINAAQLAATYPVAGLAAASLQMVVPGRLRGQLAALFLLIFSIVGQGIGPLVVALFTDYVFHDRGMLGVSMAITLAIFGPLGALVFYLGRTSMRAAAEASAIE